MKNEEHYQVCERMYSDKQKGITAILDYCEKNTNAYEYYCYGCETYFPHLLIDNEHTCMVCGSVNEVI